MRTERSRPILHRNAFSAYVGVIFAIADLRRHLERRAGFNRDQPRDADGRWTIGSDLDADPSSDDAASGGGGDDSGSSDAPSSGGSGDADAAAADSGGNDGKEPLTTTTTDETGREAWDQFISEMGPDGSISQQFVFNRDGSRILAEFAPAAEGLDWDNRYTIVSSDGDRTTITNAGDVQTTTDANTGQTLWKTEWTPAGPEPVPTVQTVLWQPKDIETAITAALTLFTWLSSQSTPDKIPIVGFKSDAFTPGPDGSLPATWAGTLTRDEVNEACPRYQEVQARTDYAAMILQRDDYSSAATYGTAVHTNVAAQVKELGDPNFVAEVSAKDGRRADYGDGGSVRVDVLERVDQTTVCAYDIKTGARGLSAARAAEIASGANNYFPGASRIIMTQIRPTR